MKTQSDGKFAVERANTSFSAEQRDVARAPTLDETARRRINSNTPRLDAALDGDAADLSDQPIRVGRFVILRELGQGGMGVVYLAYDPDLDRKVAIKLMRGSPNTAGPARARVQQEAQALAQVSHPNIVHVYEVGQSAGQIYIAMEYVPGISLAAWQRPLLAARPSVEQILHVYLQAAAGLLAAHRSGLVHRDFKPENVLCAEDGRPRVLDFGLARALHGPPIAMGAELASQQSAVGERLTQAGTILGTPGYMSPEQVRGEESDARSDQFSFCAALYDALYQQLPFEGETFEEFAREVLAGRLRPLPPGEVPIPIEQALRRGLSTDPAARFPSMQELIAALARGLHPDSESAISRRASRRFGLFIAVLMMIAMSVSLSLVGKHVDQDLRTSIAFAGSFFGFLLSGIFVLRRRLFQHTRYRRMIFFALVGIAYCLASRVFAHTLGITLNGYMPLESLGCAALLTLDAPNVSPRYYGLAGLSAANGVMVLLWPRLLPITFISIMPLVVILSIYYRIKAISERDDVKRDSGGSPFAKK